MLDPQTLGIIWSDPSIYTGKYAPPSWKTPPHSLATARRSSVAGTIQPWGCFLPEDICFSSSSSAVPPKDTGTNLDPEQGPQAMFCEVVSWSRLARWSSLYWRPGTPLPSSPTFFSLISFESLSRTLPCPTQQAEVP